MDNGNLREIPLVDVLASCGYEGPWKSRKGNTEFYGKCPVHGAKSNATSFSFEVAGRFRCFGCSLKGRGAIDLLMALRNCSYKEAISCLGSIAKPGSSTPVTPPQTSPGQGPQENPEFRGSYSKFKVESGWLDSRVSKSAQEFYGVFAYNNPARKSAYSGRIMIPMLRLDGVLVGYLARSTEPNPDVKYLMPKGIQKSLEVFGAYQILKSLPQGGRLKTCFLVESPLAVMALWAKGFAACSPYGYSLSEEQARILSLLAKTVVYLPDADKATQIAESVMRLSRYCWVRCPSLPEGVADPEYLTEAQLRSLQS